MKKLSIVIPAYNEKVMIEKVIESVEKQKVPGWEKEIIIVDDGSTDGTEEVLKKFAKKYTIILQKVNQGKGAALQEGFKQATGELIIIQDADFEYTPRDYEQLLYPFENTRVHVVYGSRFLGSHLSTMFLYALGNKFVTFLTNILYNSNITDMETGYKVFRRSILTDFTLRAKRFDFEPEFTAKVLKHGYQIYEIPISYFGRKFEEGKKLTWRDGIYAAWTLLKYRFID
ncbi:MAG: glycosyltransferase family 2 protein [Bacteroidetes bacterium]|nr:MAG: glycosyltransferase family 2 protein [Bacteroidota bacterium]